MGIEKKQVKLTIGIPVYNGEKFLVEKSWNLTISAPEFLAIFTSFIAFEKSPLWLLPASAITKVLFI